MKLFPTRQITVVDQQSSTTILNVIPKHYKNKYNSELTSYSISIVNIQQLKWNFESLAMQNQIFTLLNPTSMHASLGYLNLENMSACLYHKSQNEKNANMIAFFYKKGKCSNKNSILSIPKSIGIENHLALQCNLILHLLST